MAGCFKMGGFIPGHTLDRHIIKTQLIYSTMKLLNELNYDFDITGPKITASATAAIIENVLRVVLISDNSVTVDTGRFYVAVEGDGFVIGEIWEGRMELEGKIRKIEFYKSLGQDKT